MKHLLMALALVLSVPAFASEEMDAADVNAMSLEEMAGQEFNVDESNSVLAARPGRPPGHGGNNPGHGGPGHGGPGNGGNDHNGPGWGNNPGHGGPGWGNPGRRVVQCVASNFRGQRFQGRGLNRNVAARQALRACQSRSNFFLGRTCRVNQCRVVFGR